MEEKKCVLVSKGKAEALINLEDLGEWEKKGFKAAGTPSEEPSEAVKSKVAAKKKAAPKAPAKSRTRKRNVES